MVLHHYPEFSGFFSSHFSVPVAQESSEVNHPLLFDQAHQRQQSTCGVGTEVADAFGLQVCLGL